MTYGSIASFYAQVSSLCVCVRVCVCVCVCVCVRARAHLQNEEMLKKCVQDLQNKLKKTEQKVQIVKMQAEEKLEK